MTSITAIDWETELAELLDELATVQEDLLQALREKRSHMESGDLQQLDRLQPREQELLDRLELCHQRRSRLLESGHTQGQPVDSLSQLAGLAKPGGPGGLGRRCRSASARMRLLQHESLTNWVLAQKTMLHLAQMLEIIATGGRLRPTYGKETLPVSCGALVDKEV